jgi:glycosyltransferase involved in cell wall biosynthesis
METVSVVIPSYNRAHLIEPTVRSVLAQTHAPLEVLIVDDGSTDDTEAVCARLPAPVRYIKQRNTGLPGARNRGIQEARGEWIAFCDSDDLWHPRKLEIQLAALRTVGDARWCLTGCDIIDPEGHPVASEITGLERVFPIFHTKGVTPEHHFAGHLRSRTFEADMSRVVHHGDAFDLLFQGNIALPSSSLVARSLIDEAGPFDPTFLAAEDTEFFHRISAVSPVAYLLDPLVEYRVGHASMNSTMDPSPFIRNSLVSLDRAARLRTPLSDSERRAYRAGKRALWLHLAYCRLSVLDRTDARTVVRDAWREDRFLSPAMAGIFLGSLIPPRGLRGLHWLKRGLRRLVSARPRVDALSATGAA